MNTSNATIKEKIQQNVTYIMSAGILAVGLLLGLYIFEATTSSTLFVTEEVNADSLTCGDADLAFTDSGFTYSGLLSSYEVDYCDGTHVLVLLYWNSTQSVTVTLNQDKVVASVYTHAEGCNVVEWTTGDDCEPEPEATLEANPTTIYEGESSTLTWTSENVSSVTIPGVGTNMTANNSYVVSPSVTTTYTGYFYGENGDMLERTATVTVLPLDDEPTCTLSASPTTIYEGGSSTVTWSSTNVSSVDITNIGTGLSVSGSSVVYPSTTTTYTATCYGTNGTNLTRTVTVTVISDDELTCTLTASPSKVNKGDSTTLTWTSSNTTSGTITPDVGSVGVSGSESVEIDEATTFTGTFTNSDGERVSCSVSVSIKSNGGGRCLNCDDDDDDVGGVEDEKETDPDISLSRTITKNGSFITLDQVPYTGFEASPVMKFFFWLFVLLVSAVIAYFITKFQSLYKFQFAFGIQQAKGVNESDIESAVITKSIGATTQQRPIIQIPNLQVAYPYNDNNDRKDTLPRSKEISVVEEMAHQKNILLSPEALRLIQAKVESIQEEELVFLNKLFEKAKTIYTHEDGWILLSKDRIEILLNQEGVCIPEITSFSEGKYVKTIPSHMQMQNDVTTERQYRVEQKMIGNYQASVNQSVLKTPTRNTITAVNFAATKSQNETAMGYKNNKKGDDLVSLFVESIINTKKKEAFDILRNVTQKGIDTTVFMTLVIRQLDEAYKYRIEGKHNPNQELAKKTGGWSNNDFEVVLGILVECVDYSYSNDTICSKIALTKVFEHFSK